MCAKLVFVRRSEEKIKIFGGNVYVDLDGKNIGIIDNDNLTIDIEAGKHKIKMYKSHNYGSMVGFAEVELDIKDDEKLAFKYTCPMTITQPGHIIVSDFISYDKIESELQNEDIILKNEKKENDIKKKEADRISNQNNTWIILLVFVIPAIIWAIYDIIIFSSI